MSLLEKDKRKFSVIIGSKKCGACSGTSPSGAARKVKGKSGAFYLKETTKGSKKKLYGPYSSKKKVIQRGGTLRGELCQNLINFFLGCPDYKDKKIDDGYKSIENAFRLLGISNYDPNRYTKLKYLIFLRTNYDGAIPFCQLLCSNYLLQILNDTDIPQILDNETKFIEHLKRHHYTKISEINIDGLNIDRWRAFILHFNEQLKYMEIRNHICLDVLDVLDNCDRQSHPAHFHTLLPELYRILLIRQGFNPCDILRGILKFREDYKLRSGQTVNLLSVLFNINENLGIETLFISKNFERIMKLLGYHSLFEQRLTKMWHDVIKYIRGLIDYLVKERIEGINASEKISEQNYKNMLRNLEQAKKKEIKNNEIYTKIMKELEEAKASFQQNSLEQLNTGNSNLHQSFLLSSQRNSKKPTIPSYLLMSTINNRSGVARDGPAEAGPAQQIQQGQQGRQNSDEESGPAKQELQNFGEETGLAHQGQQTLEVAGPNWRPPLIMTTTIRQNRNRFADGRAEVKQNFGNETGQETTFFPPSSMMTTIRPNKNVKPKPPSRNNQNAGPAEGTPQSRKNLLERLAAL